MPLGDRFYFLPVLMEVSLDALTKFEATTAVISLQVERCFIEPVQGSPDSKYLKSQPTFSLIA